MTTSITRSSHSTSLSDGTPHWHANAAELTYCVCRSNPVDARSIGQR